jgi:hypothetical protein
MFAWKCRDCCANTFVLQIVPAHLRNRCVGSLDAIGRYSCVTGSVHRLRVVTGWAPWVACQQLFIPNELRHQTISISVCSHYFHHINNAAAFVAESERSLAAGGSGRSQNDKNLVDRRPTNNL